MHDGTILDLGAELRLAATSRRVSSRVAWGLAGFAAMLLVAAQMVSGGGFARVMEALGFAAPARAEATIRVSLEAKHAVESMTELGYGAMQMRQRFRALAGAQMLRGAAGLVCGVLAFVGSPIG